jgi:hypothetical protein
MPRIIQSGLGAYTSPIPLSDMSKLKSHGPELIESVINETEKSRNESQNLKIKILALSLALLCRLILCSFDNFISSQFAFFPDGTNVALTVPADIPLQPSCLHPIPCKCANAAEGSFHDL